MTISDFAIRNPVKVAVGVILVWIFGLVALLGVPVQLAPEVSRSVVSVSTDWPGASPQEIENEIISKQEEQLQDIEGIVDFRSACFNGEGEIEMEFEVGSDQNAILLKVANRLDQVQDYPEDAEEPVVYSASSRGNSIAYFSLLPAPPSRERLRAFVREHPATAEALNPLLEQEGDIDVVEVYGLAQKYPEIKELIKNDPYVPDLRTFVEDNICKRLARVPGVGDAMVFGGSQQEVRVIVDPVQLASHKITIADLRNALASENADVGAGDLWEGKRRYVIRTLGQFRNTKQVEDVIVAHRDGAPVYVRDVARVDLTVSKTLGFGRQRGVDMLTVAIQRREGANLMEVMAGLKEATAELNADFLKARNLFLFQSYDETVYIHDATRLVRSNLIAGSILTLAILLPFLPSVRSMLVIAISIPISCIGTFVVVRAVGSTINVISLAGMAFAVGMVVDNAIVVLENIFSHYQRGERPFVAASRGTSEVWGAVLASTLSTVSVFLPVAFIQEESGQLFRDLAIAISAGVAISLIVALTVVPAAASRLLRDQGKHANEPPKFLQPIMALCDRFGTATSEGLLKVNRRLQTGNLGWWGTWITIALFALGAAMVGPIRYEGQQTWPYWIPHFSPLWLLGAAVATVAFVPLVWKAPRLGVVAMSIVFCVGSSLVLMPAAEYLPEGNRNHVVAFLQPPPGYNVDQLLTIANVVEGRLRPYWEAKPGSPEAELLDGPLIDNFFVVVRDSSLFIGARARNGPEAAAMVPIIRRATEGLPGVIAFVNQASLFTRSRTGSRQIDIEITGPDLEKLIELGGRVMGQVAKLYPKETETAIRPVPSLDLGSPEVHVHRNPEKAAERGVSTAELGYAINALVDGAYAGTFWHEGKEIDLVIYGADQFAQRTQDIAVLPIGTPSGDLVAIGDVADVMLSAGPETIERIDRERAVIIEVRPGATIALEDAMNTIDEQILAPIRESGELSGLYHLRVAGTADNLRQMRTAMAGSMLLATVIIFLLLAGLYESFVYPLVIMISVPMAATGGFLGLRMLNALVMQRLDVLTMLGFIILIGTVVNNAILIVDQALQNIRVNGMPHQLAIEESVRGRIRPIFMTASTTVTGLLPLALWPGAGSELYRGLGAVVIGGLTLSTFFTMFLTPTLFALMYELRAKWMGSEVGSSAGVQEELAEAHTTHEAEDESLALGTD